ncbi:NAD-dependent epimerase/dehydratase family protein [Phytomonospora sp. NPDC050363]|uniref:NAD-dependent epimerase/dehydratase family protein n=1 Tax=Phytomonospora sp. NPDC050363 TaxID=3155642 RepID=UPI0033DFBA46
MRLLILGGNVYLSKATALHAMTRGHDVTVASRGTSGEPPAGARFVAIDRSAPDGMEALRGERFDAVIDVARIPLHVKNALAVLDTGHYGFVSSLSVYRDDVAPDPADPGTLLDPTPDDHTAFGMEHYGANKVACENQIRAAHPTSHANYRAGLIVGPGDPGDRFGYWPWRIAQGGEVLAPGDPNAPIQWIDVEDLAAWTLNAAENGTTGAYDGVAPAVTWLSFLTGIADTLGADVDFTWVGTEHLTAHDVKPWAGPGSLPFWLPPGHPELMNRDATAAIDAGMPTRPLADTVARWHALHGGTAELKAGITREKETAVLAAWHARG